MGDSGLSGFGQGSVPWAMEIGGCGGVVDILALLAAPAHHFCQPLGPQELVNFHKLSSGQRGWEGGPRSNPLPNATPIPSWRDGTRWIRAVDPE